jgi:hypothetical protein
LWGYSSRDQEALDREIEATITTSGQIDVAHPVLNDISIGKSQIITVLQLFFWFLNNPKSGYRSESRSLTTIKMADSATPMAFVHHRLTGNRKFLTIRLSARRLPYVILRFADVLLAVSLPLNRSIGENNRLSVASSESPCADETSAQADLFFAKSKRMEMLRK